MRLAIDKKEFVSQCKPVMQYGCNYIMADFASLIFQLHKEQPYHKPEINPDEFMEIHDSSDEDNTSQ